MSKSAIIDSNLLILLIVGFADQRYIEQHRRLKAFTIEDFEILKLLLQEYSELLVTPNTLSETSNLLGYKVDEPVKSRIAKVYSEFISRSKEVYINSATAAVRKEFIRLGVTDCALLELSSADVEIITVDLPLVFAAQLAGYSAVNFNYYRNL